MLGNGRIFPGIINKLGSIENGQNAIDSVTYWNFLGREDSIGAQFKGEGGYRGHMRDEAEHKQPPPW